MIINTPIGALGITLQDSKISNIDFLSDISIDDCDEKDSLVYQQIKRYFDGTLKNFSLPIHLCGTPFQKQVWAEIAKIPYGKTASYKQIAINIGKANSARAVGGACNKNPIPIIIPCHRVVGANGKLVGYNGGWQIKQFLLNLEKQN